MPTHQAVNSSAISFRGLSKSYAGNAVLRGLQLDVPAGCTFGLVGMNGAGKTTLIKCLLDFCEFDAGDIRIFGLPSQDNHARARLAFLPERFVPPYYLSGEDFLRYMMKLYLCAYEPAHGRRMFAELDLAESALRKPVRTFSKGMTQKLGLAACLLSDRELLVLDEPTAGLDPDRSRGFVELVRTLSREYALTVFMVTHDRDTLTTLATRIAVLAEGQIVADGPLVDVLHNDHPFVASFFGKAAPLLHSD